MILNIVSKYKNVSDLETMVISSTMLRLPTTHLFIASNRWDSALVEIDPSVPEGSLCNIHTVCDDIKVVLPEQVDEYCMRLLTELFPNLAGTIRKNFLLGKNLRGVVPYVEPDK